MAETPFEVGGSRAGVSEAAGAGAFKVRGLRWWIVSLIFLATLINYIDRLTISVLAPVITSKLGLTNTEFGGIVTWFLLAYTISQGVSGKLYDRVGTRLGFHLLHRDLVGGGRGARVRAGPDESERVALRARLRRGRQLAGRGEGRRRVVPRPPARVRHGDLQLGRGHRLHRRAAAHHLAGTALRLADDLPRHGRARLPLARALARLLPDARPAPLDNGRRARPDTGSARSRERGRGAKAAAVNPDAVDSDAAPRWRDLLRHRQVWAIIIARFFTDPVWWLYITWLPLYLYNARGFSLKEIGLFAWVPYVAADAGSLLGGWASGYLISRGWSVDRARKTVIAVPPRS